MLEGSTNYYCMTTVLVNVPQKKYSYNLDFVPAEVLNFVGELLSFVNGQVFELFGCQVKVAGLNPSVDNKMRTFSVLMQIANALFGEAESDAIATEPDVIAFCEALKAKGFLFSHNSKAAVIEGIKIWLQAKKLAVANQQLATRQMNAEKWASIVRNKVANRQLDTQIKSEVKRLIAG